ncbi:MAG: stage V sporulation protein AD [Bacilli bacterium]|nr:stage V sporulation protein AD [Bacilli bacterium]
MTTRYKNVYINASSSVVGPYEKEGPLKDYFDMSFDKLTIGEKTWEKAEKMLLKYSVSIVLEKAAEDKQNIDLFIAGDLLNQIVPSSNTALSFGIPFLGVYSACASYVEAMIIASNMIGSKQIKKAICGTSSHNLAAEKQFRYPTEYGASLLKTTTFTATGGASIYLSNEPSNIKIESSTIGKVIDKGQKNPAHVGAAMAPAAADTIYKHLQDMNRNIDYYDLIITGDLGLYGKEILIDYMKEEYNIDISKRYNDCGLMLYDLNKQKEVMAGGSGPACSALVFNSYILDKMKDKSLKKILFVGTGALYSTTMVYQKCSIPCVAHLISLELVE